MDYHLLHGMLSPVQMITRQPSSQDLSYHCRVLDHPSLQQFRVSNFPSYTTVIMGLTAFLDQHHDLAQDGTSPVSTPLEPHGTILQFSLLHLMTY